MHGRADAGDDVFALRVDQEIAVEGLLAGGGIAREADARAGIFALVAEDHLHDVDGGAQQAGNVLDAAVGDGFLRHPGLEHGADRAPELLGGMLGEILAGLLLKVRLVLPTSSFQPSAGTEVSSLTFRRALSARSFSSRSSFGSPMTTLEYICTKRR